MTDKKATTDDQMRQFSLLYAAMLDTNRCKPVIYVSPQGVASFCASRPDAPRTSVGVARSLVCGQVIEGFLPLEAEPFLRRLLWSARMHEPQLTAVAA